MAEYLKSMYHGQVHLVTSNYAGEKHPLDNTFDSPHMDVMTSNIYDAGEPSFGEFYIDKVARTMLNDNNTQSYTYNFTKPLIFSETDPIEALCDHSKVELRRSVWQSTFSGLAGALSWHIRLYPVHFNIYGEVRNFLGDLDLDGEDWHPGSVDVQKIVSVDGSSFPVQITDVIATKWLYNDNYAKYMDGFVDPPGNELDEALRYKKADAIFLRNSMKNLAIGLLTNKTININNISDCYTGPWPRTNADEDSLGYEPLDSMDGFNCKMEDLFVSNLEFSNFNKKYFIQYYTDFGLPIGDEVKEKIKNNRLQLKYEFWDENDSYFIPLMVRKKGSEFSNIVSQTAFTNSNIIEKNKISELHSSDLIVVYPNPFFDKIEILNLTEQNCLVEIPDLEGRSILTIHTAQNKLDLSTLKSGTYILVIKTNSSIEKYKIVKI